MKLACGRGASLPNSAHKDKPPRRASCVKRRSRGGAEQRRAPDNRRKRPLARRIARYEPISRRITFFDKSYYPVPDAASKARLRTANRPAHPCTLLTIAITSSGTQIAAPRPPTMRHHHTRPIPLTVPSDCSINRFARRPEKNATTDPIPINHTREKITPRCRSLSTSRCVSFPVSIQDYSHHVPAFS